MLKYVCLAGMLGLGIFSGFEAQANQYTSRQYYSSWRSYPSGKYYYRYYYYKPTPTYYGYKHHYVIYHPKRPQYVYYYNLYQKKYWGRCPTHCEGKQQYSLLPEDARKATLEEIPEAAFPKAGPMPKVPESDPKEGVAMDLPPDDLPSVDKLPKVSAGD